MYTAWMFGFQPKQHARIQKFSQGVEVAGCGGNFVPREGIRVQDPFLRGFSYWRTFDFLGRRPPPHLTITLKDLLSKKFPFFGGRGGGSPGSVVNLFQEGQRRGGGEGGKGAYPKCSLVIHIFIVCCWIYQNVISAIGLCVLLACQQDGYVI